MSNKKLIVGITVSGSVGLLGGQMQYFKNLGYDTYLLSPKDERSSAYCEKEGCNLLDVKIERNISLMKDIKSLFALIRIFKKARPDIVNLGTPKMGLLGLMAAKFCRVPRRIYTCRGFRYEHEHGILRKVLMLTEWISGKCAQTIICISPSVKALGVKDKLFPEKKCVVINKGSSNGIPVDYFNKNNISLQAHDELQEKLNLKGHFVYGFLGRIIDRKGINELYAAFTRIYEKDKNCRLLVVGPVDYDQIKDKNLINKMNNHEGIIMTGRTDNAPLYFSLMDLFVLPAWWEGFGNVVVQAAAMELPVISTFGTGTCDAVCDGFNGVLIPTHDDKKLEEVMIDLKDNEQKRTSLGKNGPEWARNFKSTIIWDGMDKLYNEAKR